MAVKVSLKKKDGPGADMLRRLSEIKHSRVKVGVLASGRGGKPHGRSDKDAITEGGKADLTIAQIASILEFGTEDGHIPARPALRSTFDKMHPQLTALGAVLIKAVIDGKMEVRQALNIMGAKLANAVKATITAGMKPANAPSTIARKGSSKPWVDTGRTVNAITWEVQVGSNKDETEEKEE